MIQLNSEVTLKSHMEGSKHMKKEQKKMQEGCMMQMRMPGVVAVANPVPTRVKVPVRLREKLRATQQAVVGLQFIQEFIPVSNLEMEPHYECSLCESMGQANCMFNHLFGKSHRQAFMNQTYGISSETVEMTQIQLANQAKEHHKNDPDLIRTTYSDEKYPWLPGKAPWSREQGGSGVVPEGARENYDKTGHQEMKTGQVQQSFVSAEMFGSSGDPSDIAVTKSAPSLPAMDTVKTPQSLKEAERMLELGQSLVMLASQHRGLGMQLEDLQLLKISLLAIQAKMKVNLTRL